MSGLVVALFTLSGVLVSLGAGWFSPGAGLVVAGLATAGLTVLLVLDDGR